MMPRINCQSLCLQSATLRTHTYQRAQIAARCMSTSGSNFKDKHWLLWKGDGGKKKFNMYQFLSSANKCMVQSQQPTPSPLSQLPNTAVCLVCTIVPLLWLSGRFASLANGSGAELPLTCRWFAYGQTLEIREEPARGRRRERETQGERAAERERRRAARQ